MYNVLQAFGASDKGRVRPINEDYFAIDGPLGLCVVADGMGGHNAGEVAARVAVDGVVEVVRSAFGGAAAESFDTAWPFGFDPQLSRGGNVLRTAIHVANVQVLEAAVATDAYAGMGTTIVAALVAGGRLSVAHVGDSRLYLAHRGRVRRLTTDDSWTATVLAHEPQADSALLRHHPMRNALTNVVGGRALTEVHVAEETLEGGELLVLSTDGVHGAVDDRAIGQALAGSDVRQMASALVEAALARGSRDNCTAVVARYVL